MVDILFLSCFDRRKEKGAIQDTNRKCHDDESLQFEAHLEIPYEVYSECDYRDFQGNADEFDYKPARHLPLISIWSAGENLNLQDLTNLKLS